MIKITVQKFYRINGASTQKKGVESDIVLPMSTAALPIGEAEMDYAMPYDEIAPVGHYVKNPHLARILPELRRRSVIRVAGDKDLQYSKTLVTCNMDCPIDEESVLWVGKDPYVSQVSGSSTISVLTPYNYTVTRVAKGLNSIVYALQQVNVRYG